MSQSIFGSFSVINTSLIYRAFTRNSSAISIANIKKKKNSFQNSLCLNLGAASPQGIKVRSWSVVKYIVRAILNIIKLNES